VPLLIAKAAKKKKPEPVEYDVVLAQRLLDRAIRKTGRRDAFRAGTATTGDRMVVARRVAELSEARIGRFTRDWVERQGDRKPTNKDLAPWSSEMRRTVAATHLASSRAMLGTLSKKDRERLDGKVREQFGYLDGRIRAIKSGDQAVGPSLTARARLYGAASWPLAQNLRMGRMVDDGYTYGARFLGVSEHCPGCVDEVELGWRPVEALRPIGDMECRVRCHCYLLFRRGESLAEAESPEEAEAALAAPPGGDVGTAAPSPEGPEIPWDLLSDQLYGDTDTGSLLGLAGSDTKLLALWQAQYDQQKASVALNAEIAQLATQDTPEARARLKEAAEDRQDLQARRELTRQASGQRFADIVGAGGAGTPTWKVAGLEDLGPATRKNVETAMSMLQRIVRVGKGRQINVEFHQVYDESVRASYVKSETKPEGVVKVTKASDYATVAHEVVHALEHQVPGLKEACHAFLKHRCGDEPYRKLTEVVPEGGYRADEKGRRDDFEKAFGNNAWYVGKHYKGGETEVLSMGLEKLLKNPAQFIKEDPQYARFVMAAMRGTLAAPEAAAAPAAGRAAASPPLAKPAGKPAVEPPDYSKFPKEHREHLEAAYREGVKSKHRVVILTREEHGRDSIASAEGGILTINGSHPFWSDPKGNMKRIYAAGESTTDHRHHIIRHEIGHLEHAKQSPLLNLNNNLVETGDSLKGRFSKELADHIAANTSKQAMYRANEFVAEVYAGLVGGKKYDDTIMNYYRELGGPKLPEAKR
jgi:hypothetical protein